MTTIRLGTACPFIITSPTPEPSRSANLRDLILILRHSAMMFRNQHPTDKGSLIANIDPDGTYECEDFCRPKFLRISKIRALSSCGSRSGAPMAQRPELVRTRVEKSPDIPSLSRTTSIQPFFSAQMISRSWSPA